MNRWQHVICDECYEAKYPGRIPTRAKLRIGQELDCCFCQRITTGSILIHFNPAFTKCLGKGAYHEEERLA